MLETHLKIIYHRLCNFKYGLMTECISFNTVRFYTLKKNSVHCCLRSKQIESACFSGTAAFMEVRIQSVVVEFILNHVDVLFSSKLSSLIREGAGKHTHHIDKSSCCPLLLLLLSNRCSPHYQVTTHCHDPSPCWFHRLPPNS